MSLTLKRRLATMLSVALVAPILAACGGAPTADPTTAPVATDAPPPTTAPTVAPTVAPTEATAAVGSIAEIAAGNPDFSTLVSLLSAAGLVETLSGEGPFTVFAPTNDAFAAVPAEVLTALGADTELLTRVLLYHVAAAELPAEAVVAATSATTVEGSDVQISVSGGTVTLNGNATVIATDIEASNGIIHVIDQVILPPDVAELVASLMMTPGMLPEVDPATVTGDIIIAGSSTVFPLTERMAELFSEDGYAGQITVDSIGSGGGFERFCEAAETDIANASRPINAEETAACEANGRPALEFRVGTDALAVVVSAENDFVENLTLEQIAAIYSGEAATWADVDPSYPAEPIQLFSPGTDSGTFDYFVEVIFDEDDSLILAANPQLSEDDNVLVQGVTGSPFAIGYFGYAYYTENADTLKILNIEGIEPNEATTEDGSYPLSRPLFIYSAAEVMAEKPQVASFINYYLSFVNDEVIDVGYFPASENALNTAKQNWLDAQ